MRQTKLKNMFITRFNQKFCKDHILRYRYGDRMFEMEYKRSPLYYNYKLSLSFILHCFRKITFTIVEILPNGSKIEIMGPGPRIVNSGSGFIFSLFINKKKLLNIFEEYVKYWIDIVS